MPYFNGKGEKIADTNKQYEEYKLNVRFCELSKRIKVLEEMLKNKVKKEYHDNKKRNS